MKKVLLSSFVILSTCLSQNGMCSNSNMEEINDSKQIKTSPVKTSPIIEERKIPEDELSLIIDTVNKIQTFLGEQKETLKKINTLSKK
jgi:hypothetical protein